mmetsp:Transcript_37263/g.81940  ORF Transcript_37263/g.81940 Transcript_37263/m.81940 type:complete len:374 (+) Transcript_37263:340-1461(+)
MLAMFKHARSQHPCQMRSQTAMIRHSRSVSKTPAIAHARLELPLARAALLGDVLGVVGQPADVLAAGAHVAHELDHVVQVARAVVLDAAPVPLCVKDDGGVAVGLEAGHIVCDRVHLRDEQLGVVGNLLRERLVHRQQLSAVAAVGRVEQHEHVFAALEDRLLVCGADKLDERRVAVSRRRRRRSQVRPLRPRLDRAHKRRQPVACDLPCVRVLVVSVGSEDHRDRRGQHAVWLDVKVARHLVVLGRVDRGEDGRAAQLLRRCGQLLRRCPPAVEVQHRQVDVAPKDHLLLPNLQLSHPRHRLDADESLHRLSVELVAVSEDGGAVVERLEHDERRRARVAQRRRRDSAQRARQRHRAGDAAHRLDGLHLTLE